MALYFNVINMIKCVILQELCYGPDVTRHFYGSYGPRMIQHCPSLLCMDWATTSYSM